jgi:ankyrin repeat protein
LHKKFKAKFVFMSSLGVSFNKILSTAVILCMTFKLHAQVTSRDTVEYLPEYVDNALEFNLMIAASKGLDTEVERLILRGADIEACTLDGATPLIFAISGVIPGTVNTLLSFSADPNKLTAKLESPLIIALRKLVDLESAGTNALFTSLETGCLEIAESLIRYGANIDYQDPKGVTVLNYAAAYGSFRFADLLLYYLADIDKKDLNGTTPLMSAIWTGYANVADLLIQNGANLEARDDQGFTPLLIAAQNGDTLMLHYLIKEGVDMYEKCVYGWDALSLCIKYNHKEAIEMLIKSGDKWNDSGRAGMNHYNVAARYGRDEVYKMLEKYNFPNKYRPNISQLEVSLSAKLNPKDIYTGMKFTFREPRKKFGFITGLDTKLWYTKVMLKTSEDLYYQYMDKSSLIYAGIFKDIPLTDNPLKSNFYFSGSLSGGYWFGNKFKGTATSPTSKFMILPAAGFKWVKNSFSLFAELEYMNTDFYKLWPIWLRAGLSYNFDFEFGKTPVKIIKWY